MVNTYRNLLPMTVGFDRLFSTFEEVNNILENKKPTYPPYNIYKLEDENEYFIEMAVAGFNEDEIEVTRDGTTLLVEGVIKSELVVNFLYNGLAHRDFKHKFVLNEHTIVESIVLEKGILTIKLARVIPEEKKPTRLPITSIK